MVNESNDLFLADYHCLPQIIADSGLTLLVIPLLKNGRTMGHFKGRELCFRCQGGTSNSRSWC